MKKDRLLIIEDEPSVAKQLKWALGEAYEIAVAGEAHTARKLLRAGAFAVATLDLGLPPHPDSPREGLTLLEELPALAPHTRIVVITGNSEQETALQAVALGGRGLLRKTDRPQDPGGHPEPHLPAAGTGDGQPRTAPAD